MYFITPSKPPLSLLYHYFLYYFLRCTPVSPLYEHHRSIRLRSSTMTRHPFPSIHFPRVGNLSSQHLFSAGRGDGKRRCYVKNITSYVKNITSYVNFFTQHLFSAGRRAVKTGRRGRDLPRHGNFLPRRGHFFPRHSISPNTSMFFWGGAQKDYQTPIE